MESVKLALSIPVYVFLFYLLRTFWVQILFKYVEILHREHIVS